MGSPPRSRPRSILRPSGGGSSLRSPRSSVWRSSARPWLVRAPPRARITRRWLPSARPRRQLFALDMARNLAVGVAGAVGAVVLATALSPIAPLGEARLAERLHRHRIRHLGAPARSAGHRGGRARHSASGRPGGPRRTRRMDERGRAVPAPRHWWREPGDPGGAADSGDRRPQRPGAPIRRVGRSAGLRPSGHGAGGHRPLRHGRLRREPRPISRRRPGSMGRPGAGQLRSRQRRPDQEPRPRPGGERRSPRASAPGEVTVNGKIVGGIVGNGGRGSAPVLDGGRDILPSETSRWGSA